MQSIALAIIVNAIEHHLTDLPKSKKEVKIHAGTYILVRLVTVCRY